MLHILLHFLAPALVSLAAPLPGANLKKRGVVFLQMAATMAVDLDHLLADPVYDPQRCSIGFHPLHQTWAILLYAALLFPEKSRWYGIGLLIHMALDWTDCIW